jgi:hypothetical protein
VIGWLDDSFAKVAPKLTVTLGCTIWGLTFTSGFAASPLALLSISATFNSADVIMAVIDVVNRTFTRTCGTEKSRYRGTVDAAGSVLPHATPAGLTGAKLPTTWIWFRLLMLAF